MTDINIYEFADYKSFIKHLETQRAHLIRGFRSRLAEEIGCNSGFVSQVLNTSAHFSLEQGLRIARYLRLSSDEEKFFLQLIEYARAGTPALREYFKNSLEEFRTQHLEIKGRVKQQITLTPDAQAIYYSQWYYAAIHMLITIPKIKTVADITKALNLKTSIVEKAVSFLLSSGLLVEKNGDLAAGPAYLHLERNSPLISKHHSNWRMVAIQSLENDERGDVHYSTVSSLSEKDVEILREKIIQNIEDYVKTVSQSSKEETLYCFNLDFFKVLND
jgi:uncharacterized protein (TIGR02147 family)